MFEWGGGTLWAGNDATRDLLGVGSCEDRLPLTEATRAMLETLSAWHDTALNWAYPPDPGPWTEEEQERFEATVAEALEVVRAELGPKYEVFYVRL